MKTSKFSFRNTAVLLILGSLLTACSKDSSAPTPVNDPENINNMKITLQLMNVDLMEDNGSMSIGATPTRSNTTSWKVNGVTRPNEPDLYLTMDSLAKTNPYVIESVAPLMNAGVIYGFQNFGSPMTFHLKVEINGKVVNDDNVTLQDQQTADKHYSY